MASIIFLLSKLQNPCVCGRGAGSSFFVVVLLFVCLGFFGCFVWLVCLVFF